MSGRGLSIRAFQTPLAADWQAYADRHPGSTLFHGLAWKQAVERSFGHRGRYLLATRGDRVVGIFPLFEVKSVVARRLLVSLPYATYGGVLADDDEAAAALFGGAQAIAVAANVRVIEIRSIRASVPSLAIHRSHAVFRKALPSRAEDVLAGMPRKARAAARRAAEGHQLSVDFDRASLPIVWELYSRSMRRLGSPNYPYRFFQELVAATGERNVIQLVRHRGRPVAGLMSFLFRDTVMPYFAGLDERLSLYGLNNFLYAESMRWGVEHGYRTYDFGRTRVDNIGTFNFKRFCGFEPQLLEYQTCVMPGHVAPDLSAGSPKWAAARRVWKALPLPITRPLGGWLAKSIPG
jgi:FemAB-related protein (PEP-CTERM system-associated)